MSIDIHILLKLGSLKGQIDVIYVPYTSNSPLAYPTILGKVLYQIPYIISIHGGGMYPWKPRTPHSLFFKNAGDIVAVSETIKKEYEKRCKRKINVIPPLVPFNKSQIPKDEIRNKYGFNEQDTIILIVGSIKKIKGSDILLNAFIMLGKEYIKKYNLKLLYVGDGPMRIELQKKCNDNDFSQYIKFFGTVSYENIPDMYKLADIYVIPSLFEGTPISLLEAMFNGLAIIGSNTVGINNIIKHGENGLLFEKGSIIDLKRQIKKVLGNIEASKRLGGSAEDFYFKNYNFYTITSGYIHLMKNVRGE